MYVVAPNMGTYYLIRTATCRSTLSAGGLSSSTTAAKSSGEQEYGGTSTYVAGVIDIEALRYHRDNAQWDNWMKDLRTELYRLLYEDPIYPKNLYLDRAPMKHQEYRKRGNRKADRPDASAGHLEKILLRMRLRVMKANSHATSADAAGNFLFEKDGPLSTITFNRPKRRNCMNREVMAEFERLIHRVRDDRETRVLIVTGTGAAFSAGADVSGARDVKDPDRAPAHLCRTQRGTGANDRPGLRSD